jgi:hypothetical protein
LIKEPNLNPQPLNKKTRALEPVVEVGYSALNNQGYPSDNSAAVNKNNQLICVVNSSIRYYNTNTGAGLAAVTALENFFASPQNGALKSNNLCDPKVIFDPVAEKFIAFAQTCDGNSSTSQLLLAFSKTSDPTSGWYFYQFSGNQSAAIGQSSWFDYPKIGVSNSDVFVSGNLFDNNFQYVQSVVFQINKTKCYAGAALAASDAVLWYNMPNSPFTLVPVSNGQLGGYGNNMYILATLQVGNNTNIGVYEVTNSVNNNPQLTDQYVGISSAPPPADGDQKGTNYKLDMGDNRGMDGFYLNGTIHYVFHCSGPGNYAGVSYSRLKKNGANWTVANNQIISIPNKDIGFPSIGSFGWTNNDQSSLIYFNYSSTTDYPGMKAIYVSDNFQISNPVEVKTGLGYSNLLDNGKARWGDYSAVTRVHNATKPTVWVFGMYGAASHSWINHFAKLTTTGWPTATEDITEAKSTEKNVTIYPNPVVEDIYSISMKLAENGPMEISLLDMTGKFIKSIYKQNAVKGENLFSFNKGALPAGNYIVHIIQNDKLISNEKISVIR